MLSEQPQLYDLPPNVDSYDRTTFSFDIPPRPFNDLNQSFTDSFPCETPADWENICLPFPDESDDVLHAYWQGLQSPHNLPELLSLPLVTQVSPMPSFLETPPLVSTLSPLPTMLIDSSSSPEVKSPSSSNSRSSSRESHSAGVQKKKRRPKRKVCEMEPDELVSKRESNRASARKSRERKREREQDFMTRYQSLEQENHKLKKKLQAMSKFLLQKLPQEYNNILAFC